MSELSLGAHGKRREYRDGKRWIISRKNVALMFYDKEDANRRDGFNETKTRSIIDQILVLVQNSDLRHYQAKMLLDFVSERLEGLKIASDVNNSSV